MRFTTARWIPLFLASLASAAGCSKSYCDTADTAPILDTADTEYLGARRAAPDSGWRIRLSR